MRSGIVPGATFPDYSLPDHTGPVGTPPLGSRAGSRSRPCGFSVAG